MSVMMEEMLPNLGVGLKINEKINMNSLDGAWHMEVLNQYVFLFLSLTCSFYNNQSIP